MKNDLSVKLEVSKTNLDLIIRLCRSATDFGVWTPKEAQRHIARLESLGAKMNAHFRELFALREHADEVLERARKQSLFSIS